MWKVGAGRRVQGRAALARVVGYGEACPGANRWDGDSRIGKGWTGEKRVVTWCGSCGEDWCWTVGMGRVRQLGGG